MGCIYAQCLAALSDMWILSCVYVWVLFVYVQNGDCGCCMYTWGLGVFCGPLCAMCIHRCVCTWVLCLYTYEAWGVLCLHNGPVWVWSPVGLFLRCGFQIYVCLDVVCMFTGRCVY